MCWPKRKTDEIRRLGQELDNAQTECEHAHKQYQEAYDALPDEEQARTRESERADQIQSVEDDAEAQIARATGLATIKTERLERLHGQARKSTM